MSDTETRRPEPVGDNDRRPPADLDAEGALIGALLLTTKHLADVAGIVEAGDFYKPAHGTIFDAIVAVTETGAKADPVTVADHLRRHGQLDHVGGPGVLTDLQGNTPAIGNAPHYATIVAKLATLRRMHGDLREAQDALYRRDVDRASEWIDQARRHAHQPDQLSTWQWIDLAPVVDGERPPAPDLLGRSDGIHLVYSGKIHSFIGESESGKSWLALLLCGEVLAGGGDVIYIDFEDDQHSMVERLLDAGTAAADIVAGFHYVRPDDPFTAAARAAIENGLEAWKPTVAVLDGVTEALSLMGAESSNNDTDIARFYAALPKMIARSGTAVVLIDHVPKKKDERGKGATGSQHKRAAITGATYVLDMVKPFARGKDGEARVTIDKDRPGHVRGAAPDGKSVGTLHLDSTSSGVRLHVEPPPASAGDAPQWDGPTRCMEAVEKVLRSLPGVELTQAALRNEMRMAGETYQDKVINEAAARLALLGRVSFTRGPRNSYIYSWRADGTQVAGIELPAGHCPSCGAIECDCPTSPTTSEESP